MKEGSEEGGGGRFGDFTVNKTTSENNQHIVRPLAESARRLQAPDRFFVKLAYGLDDQLGESHSWCVYHSCATSRSYLSPSCFLFVPRFARPVNISIPHDLGLTA
jgi:hypothetical protein